MSHDHERKVNNPFLSLRHMNYRLYWIGMCVSLIGTWMQNVAQPWLAYTLSKSPLLLSLIGAAQFLPTLFFGLFIGVFIDRFPKKKILIFTQTVSMLIALTLALLIWTHQIQYWHILSLSLLLGFVNTLDMPTRHSFIIEMVGREDLTNAIALNSMAFNVARIFGPALAGLVMGWFGAGFCFFINGISFLAVLTSLFFIKPLYSAHPVSEKMHMMAEIKDAIGYVSKRPILLEAMALIGIVSTFAVQFNVLIPVFVKDVLAQNESTFGLLMSFLGVGSFLGATLVASLGQNTPTRLILRLFPWISICGLMLLGFSHSFMMTGLLLLLCGFVFVTFSSTCNSAIQLNTSDTYRSRVVSFYTLIFTGFIPFGSVFSGYISEYYGASIGFIANSLMIALLLLVFYTWLRYQKAK